MLTVEENERLTQVGPGTRMGRLLRRYWYPIAAQAQLEKEPVMPVTLLGEPLVLYRDRGGRTGLLAEPCMHRRASLAYGIPEERGLRCPYHGWLYAEDGQCLEQPAFPWTDSGGPSVAESSGLGAQARDDSFSDRIRTTAYPVQELGGLIFAYLGEPPAPVLPRYNVLVWDHAIRETQGSVIAANWLQVVENVLDPAHVEFLHGRFFAYYLERQDRARADDFRRRYAPGHVQRIAFERFEAGLLERHLMRSEIEPTWRRGTATFFPSTVMGGTEQDASLTFLVPLDDTHTWFLMHMAERPGATLPLQKSIRFREVPGVGPDGRFVLDMANGQDHMATVTQGAITRRDLEHLGAADVGLVLYRDLLMEQLEQSERGDDPINVRRDPTAAMIDFPRRSSSQQPSPTKGKNKPGRRPGETTASGGPRPAVGPADLDRLPGNSYSKSRI